MNTFLNIIYVEFVMVSLLFISSCGEKVDPHALKIVQVFDYTNKEDKTYSLEIPNAYRPHEFEGRGSLFAAYPGMVGYSPEIRHRFFTKNNANAPDQVAIKLRMKSIVLENGSIIGHQNDLGASIKQNYMKNPRYKKIPLTENLNESEKIAQYSTLSDDSDDRRYVITHKDARISFVSCIYSKSCEGITTWRGNFGIKYLISRQHLNNIVDLDRSVISLVDSFNPTLVVKEK